VYVVLSKGRDLSSIKFLDELVVLVVLSAVVGGT
jgi:hypothetical protein